MTTTQNAAYPLETFGPYGPLPNGDGGYQLGAGNLVEGNMQVATVTSLTGDATLTAAQVAGGIISCNKGSDAGLTVTTPTGTLLDAGFEAVRSLRLLSTLTLRTASNTSATRSAPQAPRLLRRWSCCRLNRSSTRTLR